MSIPSSLGELIASSRRAAGMRQPELAVAVGVSQQTVSKWEAGKARPSLTNIAKIADLLSIEEQMLLDACNKAAEFGSAQLESAVSIDRPFPVDALTPDSFERFIHYILGLLYPDAVEIRPLGASGHTQGGADILVFQKGGEVYSFQCKRRSEFGPSDVKKAVQAHTVTADRKFIVLSRVASPQTSAAVREFQDWTLWDKEDISRQIRMKLGRSEQIRIVDTFFRGQRLALLGDPSPGPWQTSDEFFAPFNDKRAAFSHVWPMIGRDRDLETLSRAVIGGEGKILFLVGEGGIGKSRLIKRLVEDLASQSQGLHVFFLSPTEPLNAHGLDQLTGNRRFVIVDDAHDRDDLSQLFAYTARHSIRLLVATRPYAVSRLRGLAGQFAQAASISEFKLQRLNFDETLQLAKTVLRESGGNELLGEAIANATRDCPLVTVMAAKIAAVDDRPLALAQNADEFRDTILGKFAKVLTGELATHGDQKSFSRVVNVIALVQPFNIESDHFRGLLREAAELTDDEIAINLRALVDGGIVFRRGAEYRLMPDLLGDYIIEQSCLDIGDRLNSFANRVFTLAPSSLLPNVLVNLGRLDWRRNGGDPSRSRLLEHLWSAISRAPRVSETAMEAAASAAFYQPKQALLFVEDALRKGATSDTIVKVLQNVAFDFNFLKSACLTLWDMAIRTPSSAEKSHSHPIRVLTDLCAVKVNKPVCYNRRVVLFGLKLLRDEKLDDLPYSPFDFLKGILSGAGDITTSDNHTVTFKSFVVNYDAIKRLRQCVIKAALRTLQSGSSRVAAMAAEFLGAAMHYPMVPFSGHLPDEMRCKYTDEFQTTLASILQVVRASNLDGAVMIAIARAISWHHHHGPKATQYYANAIFSAFPKDISFRVLCGLDDSYGQTFMDHSNGPDWFHRTSQWLESIVTDASASYPNSSDLRAFLERCILQLKAANLMREEVENNLISKILQNRADLAVDIVESAIAGSETALSPYLGLSLSCILKSERRYGLLCAQRLLNSGDVSHKRAVGRALVNPTIVEGALLSDEADILKRLLMSQDRSVVFSGAGALGSIARESPRTAIALLRHTNMTVDSKLADHILMLLLNGNRDFWAHLTEEDAKFVTSQLQDFDRLDGYWIETFISGLSSRFPFVAAKMILSRAEKASRSNDAFGRIQPIPFGPWTQIKLKFCESEAYPEILALTWSWMTSRELRDWRFGQIAGQVFVPMFAPFDAVVTQFLVSKLDTASDQDIIAMSDVLSHVESSFVFEKAQFVAAFLDACTLLGETIRQDGVSALFRSAVSGPRSGQAGKPFPQDLEIIERSKSIIQGLSRFSPAYELYSKILRHAESSVEIQLKRRGAHDEG